MANPAIQASNRLAAKLALPARDGVPTSLVECLSEGVITADRQGTVLYASGPALSMIGMRAADVLGKSLETVIPDFSLNDALVAASKEIALPSENEFSRSIAISAHPMAIDGQDIITTVLTDHSERDAARDALAKSNARYALAAAGANDGLWEWDLAEGTVQFSARWRTLLGLEATTLKHTPEEWLSRIHPEDVDSFCDSFDSHL